MSYSYGIIDVLFTMLNNSISPSLSIFKQILKLNPPDLNSKDGDGHTLIYYSITNGHLNITKFLFNTVKVDSDDVNSGFINACQVGYIETVKYVSSKTDSKTKTRGFTLACQHKHVEIARYMIIKVNIYLNTITGGEKSLLMIRNLHPKICQLLLDFGLDVNYQAKNGQTVLLTAVEDKNIEVLKLLVEVPNIDANIKNKDGKTALMIGYIDIRILKLLIRIKGIDANVKYNFDNTIDNILIYILYRHFCDTMDIWVKYSKTLEEKIKNTTELIKLLLQIPDIDVNARNKHENKHVICYAIQTGDYEICKLLMTRSDLDLSIVPYMDIKRSLSRNQTFKHHTRIKGLFAEYMKSKSLLNFISNVFNYNVIDSSKDE